ncbi:MAG TPA: ABC transporter substrate-binding protein [Candidatus Sulfotelmatobacter sp.]|nr:ABC transporter substrate-binding protein [Candidatus Sulfotelmatobacter sp.]
MTQEKVSTGGSSLSKLKQTKYILAILVIVIVVAAAVTAVFFLPKASALKVDVGAGPRIRFLGFNVNNITDVRVRQAIAYAVDRDAINTNVFLGLATPIYSMIPPSMPYNQPVFKTKYGAAPNLTLAENLLTAAGHNSSSKGKLYIDLWYNSDGHYGDTEPSVALVIKTSLEKTGMITVSLKSEPWAAYRGDLAKGRFPFYMLGWYPDYLDADDYAAPFFGTSGAIGQGSFYSDATMDKYLKNEAGTVNDNFRAGNFTLIQNKSALDVPYIPLWQQTADVEYKSDITGVYLHPVSFKYFVMNKPGATQLNVGTTDSVVCLDPACAYDYYSIEIINQVFDTLLVYSPTNATLLPGLATEVPTLANGGISSDSMNYTYHLRQGVKFSDGTPFNATVVKYSIERAMGLGDPTSGNNYYGGGNYAGSAGFLLFDSANLGTVNYSNGHNNNITVVDNYTIKFHLKQATAFFNEIMAFSVAAPVSMSAYKYTAPATIPPDDKSHIVGTGPYMVSDYSLDKQVILVKNPNYYLPGIYSSYGISTIPIFNQITVTHYSDATGLKNALVSGQIDMAYRTLNPTDIKSLQH